MPDVIQLLPESVANQIAAGEVVQRPASIVKELLENAIDAEATSIKLILKDAGKTLIQVTDNGCGMSETDARMAFERHATSKIKKIEDLFSIMTKGFRGEALASIAAVAQVEMKTKKHGATLGTHIDIEGSKLKLQEPVQTHEGTTLQVKNLFFNVPARRYFLKNDSVELRHCIDEFQRVAFAHPAIEFHCMHNGSEVFTLPKTSLRQRIVHILGNRYNERLVPVEEATDIVKVSGYVGKPDTAKRTRGEQFFFVNNRFIKNSYLNHAVMSAFEQLLPGSHFPLYILYLEIPPEQIDINIHPTKTEIKFRDERAVYAILLAAVRRALGRHNISPTLDFNQENSIQLSPPRTHSDVNIPRVKLNPEYNPFPTVEKNENPLSGWFKAKEKSEHRWKELMQIGLEVKPMPQESTSVPARQDLQTSMDIDEDIACFQMHRKFLVLQVKEGLMLIDQQRAHQRILFEKYFELMEKGNGYSQQLLFPETITLSPADFTLMQSIIDDVRSLGFELEEFGGTTFKLSGTPSEASGTDATKLLENFLEQLKNERSTLQNTQREKMAWALARATSVRYGQMLTEPEMRQLVHELFRCKTPYSTEFNKPTVITIPMNQLEQSFR